MWKEYGQALQYAKVELGDTTSDMLRYGSVILTGKFDPLLKLALPFALSYNVVKRGINIFRYRVGVHGQQLLSEQAHHNVIHLQGFAAMRKETNEKNLEVYIAANALENHLFDYLKWEKTILDRIKICSEPHQ